MLPPEAEVIATFADGSVIVDGTLMVYPEAAIDEEPIAVESERP